MPYATLPREINVTFACLVFALVFFQDFIRGLSVKNIVIDSNLLAQKININDMIIVEPNGQGDFKSIQAAIDSIPNGNSNWITIDVKKGIYREKVQIPRNKPYIFLRGDGRGKTSIESSDTSPGSYDSATFKVEAPHFIAIGISFKNEGRAGSVGPSSRGQSVAVVVGADKVAFYNCAFFSNHNTLFDYKGRHYFDNCYIQGSVDFIYGRGQSIFHGCEIFVIGNRRAEIQGSITAHSRHRRTESSGFVFLNSRVYGIGEVHLGRAKGAHSRVVFANTYLSKTIVPHGWTNSSYSGSTRNLYQAEYRCYGPGSSSKDRAPWSKQLTRTEAAQFLSIDFVKGKDWLPATALF